jgi:hypothetical protein
LKSHLNYDVYRFAPVESCANLFIIKILASHFDLEEMSDRQMPEMISNGLIPKEEKKMKF